MTKRARWAIEFYGKKGFSARHGRSLTQDLWWVLTGRWCGED